MQTRTVLHTPSNTLIKGEASVSKASYLEDWLVFAVTFALNLAMIWVVVFHLGIFVTDAMARTRSAWQVFFSAEPRLTNVGLVWSPLPTILQLPLVLLPPLRVNGISGNLVTAVMGAGTAVLLNSLARSEGWPRIGRFLLVTAFALNPMVLFYSANGMSEMTLIFFSVWTILLWLDWCRTRRRVLLIWMGVACSLAFLSRYDALVLATILCILVFWFSRRDPERKRGEAEGSMLAFAAPVGYATFMWVYFNWTIMGDPLYFATSPYSNAGQINYQLAVLPNIAEMKHDLPRTAGAILQQLWQLFPPFILLSVGLAVLVARRRDPVGLGLLAVAWSFPLFTWLNLFMGQSALFLRYFILAIPTAFLLGVWIAPRLGHFKLAGSSIVLLLGLSAVITGLTMEQASDWGQWNDIFIRSLLRNERVEIWAPEKELASHINGRVHGREVLVDDFQGYRVIFFSGHPEYFCTPADGDFQEVLRHPYGKVTYILSSSRELEGSLNQVNIAYPTLYANGGSWVVLEKESWVWKLYRVVGQPE